MQISGSKAFSYAGQRIGVTAISDKLYHRAYPGLTQRYGGGTFGNCIHSPRIICPVVRHEPFGAVRIGSHVQSCGRRNVRFYFGSKRIRTPSRKIKKDLYRLWFPDLYDHDLDEPIADGFYFTIAYPGMTGGELMEELIYYGVSAISLSTTGSNQEGLRACTSFIKPHQYALLEERLKLFKENHTA